MLSAMELLEAEDLVLVHHRLRRGWWRTAVEEHRLVDGLSFVLRPGGSLAIVGDSRDALSAVALAVLKQREVAEGIVRFSGVALRSLDERRFRPMRKRIQAVFPDSSGQLSPSLTVREAFRETLDVWHRRAPREERAKRVESVMIACGLPEAVQDLYPAELDAAERQLVALARALLPGPELLVCRGFTEGLDTVQQAELLHRLRHVREEFGLALLVLVDDLAVAHHLADDLAVLHRGRLAEAGPIAELTQRPGHEYTRRLVACAA